MVVFILLIMYNDGFIIATTKKGNLWKPMGNLGWETSAWETSRNQLKQMKRVGNR